MTDGAQKARLLLKMALEQVVEVDQSMEQFDDEVEKAGKKLLGFVSALRTGKDLEKRLSGVAQLCDEARAADPDAVLDDGTSGKHIRARALMLRGLVYVHATAGRGGLAAKADLRKALEFMEEGVREAPTAEAYWSLSQVQGRLGDRDAAIRSLRECISLDPNGRPAVEAAKQLRSLGAL